MTSAADMAVEDMPDRFAYYEALEAELEELAALVANTIGDSRYTNRAGELLGLTHQDFREFDGKYAP